jgi:4-carboxymuconolactone decarboxylase
MTADREIEEKTRQTASLYFKDVSGELPFALWKAFDRDLAKDLSLFITGKLYGRERIDHRTRQLVTISALTVLGRQDELALHLQAALNCGCSVPEMTEVIFQTFTYGGIPTVNAALKTLRGVLEEKGMWPVP